MKKFVLMVMLMAPIAVFAQKFGKVNTQAIMQSLPELSKVNGELEAAAKQYENELKSMQEELQTLYQKIQQTYQDNQQALQKTQQEKMQPVITKVRNAIQNVGNAGGFTYIFEEGAAVYTGTNVEDVTSKVQSELTKMK